MAAEPAEARAAFAAILAFDDKVTVTFAPQVEPGAWDRLDEPHRRALLLDKVLERTARLRVVCDGPGRFTAESRGVKRFRLLLTPEMLGKDGAVEVRWAGRNHRRKCEPDAAVLLREFAERFDRTFLPVAEVVVP